MKSKLWIVCIALFMFMCNNDDDPKAPAQGQVSFGMSSPSLDAGRTRALDLDEALVKIEKTSGEIVYDGVISLTAFGDSYISEQLALSTGEYKLTKFMLLKSGSAKYAAPLTGSPKAPLVERPLPIDFSIQSNTVTTLLPEVVAIENASPGQFGYVEFGFEIVEDVPALKSLLVSATIANTENSGQPVDGTLTVFAKNTNGEVTWSNTWPIATTKEITVPVSHRYSFTLSKAGHLPHSQYYLFTDLKNVSNLYFELIPEGSDDFITKQLYNGKITVYYPADRAKLYLRVDVAEDFNLAYLYADRGASSMTGFPVLPLITAEVDGHGELVGRAVNLFFNAPFASAPSIEGDVDMSHSSFVKDFNRDVEVESYLLSVTQDNVFADDLFYWNFDPQPFYNYWCQTTHNFCDHANGLVDVSGRKRSNRDAFRNEAMRKRQLPNQ